MIGLPLRALTFIGRHATRFLAIGVLLGLALPWLAELLRPGFIVFLLVPLVIALVRLDWGAFIAYGKRPLLLGPVAAWILLISPVLVLLVLRLVPLPEPLMHAIVLMASAPPIVSSAVFALILGLDAPLAVAAIILTTALVPLTLPPLALQLLGIQMDIDLLALMGRLGLVVGAAFGAAGLIRWLIPRERLAKGAQILDGVSVLNLLCFAISIMAGVTDAFIERPGYVLLATLMAFVANILLQITGSLLAWPIGARAALTIGLMSGNRNMGLVLIALADKASFDTVIFFAVGQIPMYSLPALLNPIYAAIMRRAEEKT